MVILHNRSFAIVDESDESSFLSEPPHIVTVSSRLLEIGTRKDKILNVGFEAIVRLANVLYGKIIGDAEKVNENPI